MYRLAQELHKTVGELLTGDPVPLSHAEFVMWNAFYELDAEDAEKKSKTKPRKSNALDGT